MQVTSRRCALGAVLLLGSVLQWGGGDAIAQPVKIGKPQSAPPGSGAIRPLPPAAIDDALAIGGEELPARKRETRLTVEVRVNGRGPYQFLVDSGADTSVIGVRLARELQLPLGTPAMLSDMTSRHLVARVKIARLTLGPTTISDLQVPALREIDVGGDGMIGIDALVRQRLMMDFEKKVIKVEDASKPAPVLPGDIVVTARRRGGQLIITRASAARLPIQAVIDTGSQITIGNLALRDRLLQNRKRTVETIRVTGVTGVSHDLQLAVLDELKLGSVTLRNVTVAFADVPPFGLFGLGQEPALLIGTDLLENFRRVSLDFRSRKVRFQLRRCGASTVIMSTSYMATRILSGDNAEVCRR